VWRDERERITFERLLEPHPTPREEYRRRVA
jgi:hypothetical protein